MLVPKYILDKLVDKKIKFQFDDEVDDVEDNENDRSASFQNASFSDSNESYCKYCLVKLASFQIDFDQVIRLCSNVQVNFFIIGIKKF
jgi:hypothetical protein